MKRTAQIAAVVALVVLILSAIAGAWFFRRSRAGTKSACGGALPIPGPEKDLLDEAHLKAATLSKGEPDEPRIHPATTMVVMQRSLVVMFDSSATIGEANAALCSAGVQITSTIASVKIVNVYAPAVRDFSDLDDVRVRLLHNRVVSTVSLNTMVRSGNAGEAPKMGTLSRPPVPLCDWAQSRIMETYQIKNPLSCGITDRAEVNGRQIQIALVRKDAQTKIFAIVDDDGSVYPVVTSGELANVPLTGKTHWSQRTRLGRTVVQRRLFEADRSAPEPPRIDLQSEFRTELSALRSTAQGCIDQHLGLHPEAKGMVVNLAFKIHPNGRASDPKVLVTVDRDGSMPDSPAEQCLLRAATGQAFKPYDTEDIYSLTEVFSAYPSR